MSDPADGREDGRRVEPKTLVLAGYFVALIGIVAALLLLPAIL